MKAVKRLFAEDTDVSAAKSVSEITALLIESGARAITTEHENGKTSGLNFCMPYGAGQIPYKLPVRIEPVFIYLQKRRSSGYDRSRWKDQDRAKAERIAWRQLFWWLKSQIALIQLGMVEPAEVLMPYMLGADGQSFFDTYRGRLLEAPKGTA